MQVSPFFTDILHDMSKTIFWGKHVKYHQCRRLNLFRKLIFCEFICRFISFIDKPNCFVVHLSVCVIRCDFKGADSEGGPTLTDTLFNEKSVFNKSILLPAGERQTV